MGRDLITGAVITPEEYKAQDPRGKAILKAADYQPPHEEPTKEYPFWMTTGRLVYHFHTRTKTGCAPELAEAAPDAYAEMNGDDATTLGPKEGDFVRIESRRGGIEVPVRICRIDRGRIFVPLHYGYRDDPARREQRTNPPFLSGTSFLSSRTTNTQL